jgi:hypothetical protein
VLLSQSSNGNTSNFSSLPKASHSLQVIIEYEFYNSIRIIEECMKKGKLIVSILIYSIYCMGRLDKYL